MTFNGWYQGGGRSVGDNPRDGPILNEWRPKGPTRSSNHCPGFDSALISALKMVSMSRYGNGSAPPKALVPGGKPPRPLPLLLSQARDLVSLKSGVMLRSSCPYTGSRRSICCTAVGQLRGSSGRISHVMYSLEWALLTWVGDNVMGVRDIK